MVFEEAAHGLNLHNRSRIHCDWTFRQTSRMVTTFLAELPLGRTPTAIRILGDNQGSLDLVKNAEHHDRTKHIDVQHHYVRELGLDDYVRMEWVPTRDELADGFTKALPKPIFEEHRKKLGIMPIIPDKIASSVGKQ